MKGVRGGVYPALAMHVLPCDHFRYYGIPQGLADRIGRAGDRFEPLLLLDNNATRQAVIDGFRQHLRKATQDDVALFYYSGYGSQEQSPPQFWYLEPDRLDETLVCWDSRLEDGWDLADKELAQLIAEVAANGPHIAVILDCCHSVSGTRAPEERVGVRRVPTDEWLGPSIASSSPSSR